MKDGEATTIFESAIEFGLTPGEIWDAVMATLERLPDDVRVSYIEDLSGALAARLLDKERGLWLGGAPAVHQLGKRGGSSAG